MVNEIDFNRTNDFDYIATHKLPDGKFIRIFFVKNIGTIPKINYYGWIYSVGLAVGKKKDINNWFESAAYNKLTDLPTFTQYGASTLYWAKRAIEQFIDIMKYRHNKFCIAISGEDARRQRVYEKYCLKHGYFKGRVNYGGEFKGYVQDSFSTNNTLIYYYNWKDEE